MTPSETVVLTRYVAACCPQQAIDDYTPDAWHDLLSDLSAADCRAAVTAVAKRQPFVAPAEIRAEVRRIRRDRLEREIPAPPPELADEPGKYQQVLQASIKRIADGKQVRLAIGAAASEQPPPPVAEVRKALGPAIPPAERLLSPQEAARRQVAESRAARGARATTEPDDAEPAA